jgi:cell division protein FtsL
MRIAAQPRIASVLLFSGAALLLTAVGVFHIWSHTQVIASGYELARLEAEGQRFIAERDRLRLEVATLRAPARVENFARTQLGMAPPAPGTVVAGMAGRAVALGGRVGAEGTHPLVSAEPVVTGVAARKPSPGKARNPSRQDGGPGWVALTGPQGLALFPGAHE